jgi:ABC-type transport system involved in multi-copper enzyme maturation permease subunit
MPSVWQRSASWIRRQPWSLWSTQTRRIVSLETRRNLFSWRAAWIYFLAFVPVAIISLHVMIDRPFSSQLAEDTDVLAGIMQFYYLRLAIFFGCLGIFSRLIRGEMVERSLHYYLLAPVRREVLLLAKFMAGSLTAILLFGTAVLLDFVVMYSRFGSMGYDFVFNGPGLGQLEAYLGITALACLGYGSVFLLLSMLFRNPTPAAMLVMGWEALNPILPKLLQKISVASYLRHLMPVTVPGEGIFALLAVSTEPVRPWMAAIGVLIVTAVVVTISCYRMRTLEIRYTTE